MPGIVINIKTKFANLDEAHTKIRRLGTTGVSEARAMKAAFSAVDFKSPTRAAEAFAEKILGLGKIAQFAFPVIGALAFGQVIFEVGKKVYEFFKKIDEGQAKIRDAFYESSSSLKETNDSLDVTIIKLQNANAKLEGKPQNNLKLAVAEAREEADKLNKSLDESYKKIAETLKEEQGNALWNAIAGSGHNTSDMTDELAKFMLAQRGKTPHEQKQAADAEYQKYDLYQQRVHDFSRDPASFGIPTGGQDHPKGIMDMTGEHLITNIKGAEEDAGRIKEYLKGISDQITKEKTAQDETAKNKWATQNKEAEDARLPLKAAPSRYQEITNETAKALKAQMNAAGRAGVMKDSADRLHDEAKKLHDEWEKKHIEWGETLSKLGQTGTGTIGFTQTPKELEEANKEAGGRAGGIDDLLRNRAYPGGNIPMSAKEQDERSKTYLSQEQQRLQLSSTGSTSDKLDVEQKMLALKKQQLSINQAAEISETKQYDAVKAAGMVSEINYKYERLTAEAVAEEAIKRGEINKAASENVATNKMAELNSEMARLLSLDQNDLQVQLEKKKVNEEILQLQIDQNLQQDSAMAGVRAFFQEMDQQSVKAGKTLYDALNSALDQTSANLAKLLTGQKPKNESVGKMFGDEFKSIGTQMVQSGLKEAMQKGLAAMGIQGKPDGTKGNPIYTKSADGSGGMSSLMKGGGGDPSMGGMSSLMGGGGGAAEGATSGGFGALMDSGAEFAGFADGGDVSPGWATVGENGTELAHFSGGGAVMSHDEMMSAVGGGGDTHHYHIDARGSQLGVENRIDAILKSHKADTIKQSMRATHERSSRTPHRSSK